MERKLSLYYLLVLDTNCVLYVVQLKNGRIQEKEHVLQKLEGARELKWTLLSKNFVIWKKFTKYALQELQKV